MNSGLVRTTAAGVSAAARSDEESIAVVGALIHVHWDGLPCIEGNDAVILIVLHRSAWSAVNAAVVARGGDEDAQFEVDLDCIRITPEDRAKLALPDREAIPTRAHDAGEAMQKLWA